MQEKKEPNYKCVDNCEGKIIIAQFLNKTLISIKALFQTELSTNPQITSLRNIRDLAGLESIARQEGYQLIEATKGKVLCYKGQQVAVYRPCGMTRGVWLFSEEVNKTIAELIARVDEIYKIVEESRPIDKVIEDPALTDSQNNSPF